MTEFVAAVGTLSFIVTKIVEFVRAIYPEIDNHWARLASLLIAAVLVGLWQFGGSLLVDTLELAWMDYVVAVFASAFGAGWLADISGRSGR